MNIFDMPPDQFMGALAELRQQGVDTDALLRQYRAQSSPLAPVNRAAQSASASVADQGRREVAGGLLTKQAGTTGMDAIRSLDTNFRGGLLGMLAGGGRAVDAPMAAAQGLIPQGDMALEALGTAGLASMGGAAATRPSGSFGMGGRVADALPEPRNAAERMARQILDMRAAGRASDVTDDMMAQADPQYMFNNTPLPMDEASRLARARDAGFGGDMYHGSSADFSAFDPLASDATGQKVMAFGEGSYLADAPRVANRYAERRDGGIVYPVRENMENPWTAGHSVSRLSPEDRAVYMASESGPEALGYSGRRTERGVSVVPDPANIRSRFARFDPEFAHLSNLSAANASATSGAAATSASQDRLQSLRSYLQSIPGLLAN